MTVKKFFAISIVIHIFILAGIYLLPAPETKKPKEMQARLVTPDELRQPEKRVMPLPKPAPRIIPLPKRIPLLPGVPSAKRGPTPLPLPQRSKPTQEKPMVPGEGRVAEKTPRENAAPARGTGTEGGEKGRITREGETTGRGGVSQSAPSEKPGFSPNRRMFDRGIIDQVAKKDLAGKKGETENPVTFDTKEYKFAGYMTRLKEKIESIWIYPPEEAASGHYGDLRIRFTIKKDGSLGEVQIVRMSGYPSLDKAALKALKDGEPYWPLPDAWNMDSYTIEGHFIYSLYGYQLR